MVVERKTANQFLVSANGSYAGTLSRADGAWEWGRLSSRQAVSGLHAETFAEALAVVSDLTGDREGPWIFPGSRMKSYEVEFVWFDSQGRDRIGYKVIEAENKFDCQRRFEREHAWRGTFTQTRLIDDPYHDPRFSNVP